MAFSIVMGREKPYYSWVIVQVLTLYEASSDITPAGIWGTLLCRTGIEDQALTWSPLIPQ